MGYEYLVASLPMVFFEDPPPFAPEAFRALCAGELSSEDLAAVDRILAGTLLGLWAEGAGGFEGAWQARETQLRNETAALRAARIGVDIQPLLRGHAGYDASLREAVSDAFERPNPLEREMELDRARWRILDELTVGGNPFGTAAVLAYAAKLRILARWAARTDEAGRERVEVWMEGKRDE